MKLIHYTHADNPLTEIRNPEPSPTDPLFKPTGFWVSDEDEYGWSQWCSEEGFRVGHLELAYEIILVPDHNIRILTTIKEIKELTRNYRTSTSLDRNYRTSTSYELDWMKMKEQWNGLIITPYQWELRLDTDHMWYYGWDCASGCIWNPAAVADFKEVDTVCPK